MKQKNIPNDLYNYHLQFLVKKGLVLKNEKTYSLSEFGIKYVADPLTENNPSSSLFKFNVITIVSRIVNGKIEILNQIRKSNPSYGKVGIPGGVVLKGESVLHGAKRKLEQETGLIGDFKLVAIERRIMYKQGELFSDMLFPITYADSYSGILKTNTDFGQNMWVPISKAIKNESSEYDSIKSIVKVLKAIKSGKIKQLKFFFEENTQSDL